MLYGLALWTDPSRGLVELGFLFGAPIAACALAIVLIDPKGKLGSGAHVALGALVVAAMVISAFFAIGEAGVCVVMASPVFLALGVSSAALTGAARRWRAARRFPMVAIVLPLLIIPVQGHVNYPVQEEAVVTVEDIAAPTQVVWANILSVRNIRPAETRWTFTQDLVGVPKPIDAVMVGQGVGSVRYATWARGVHFEERVSRWRTNEDLAWTFHFAPDSIPREVEGHINPASSYLRIADGAYHLEPLPGGRTRLTLSTHYWMKTPVNAYSALWGRIFIGDFHSNVLRVVGARAEASARSLPGTG